MILKTNEVKKFSHLKNRDLLKQYYLKNYDKIISCHYEYIKKRKESDLFCNIAGNLRSRTNRVFKSQINRNVIKASDLFGCSHPFFKRWIVHQLFGNMNVESYCSVWCIDLCLPIASFNILDESEMKKVFIGLS